MNNFCGSFFTGHKYDEDYSSEEDLEGADSVKLVYNMNTGTYEVMHYLGLESGEGEVSENGTQ